MCGMFDACKDYGNYKDVTIISNDVNNNDVMRWEILWTYDDDDDDTGIDNYWSIIVKEKQVYHHVVYWMIMA